MRYFKSFILACICFASTNVLAQEQKVIGSGGASVSTSSGSLSFTVGEIVVETASSSTNEVTQGFHQSFLTPTAIDEVPASLELSIYPNPTSDLLIVESPRLSELEAFHLYDMNGKLIWQKVGNHSDTRLEINFHDLAAGTYLLRLGDVSEDVSYTYNVVKGQ